jgi:hypothetical protein
MNRHEATSALYRIADKLEIETKGFDAMSAAAGKILRAAKKLNRLSEMECNGVPGPDGFMKWDEVDQAKADKTRDAAVCRVWEALGEAFSDCTLFAVENQGDPRGASVIIHTRGKEDRLASFY